MIHDYALQKKADKVKKHYTYGQWQKWHTMPIWKWYQKPFKHLSKQEYRLIKCKYCDFETGHLKKYYPAINGEVAYFRVAKETMLHYEFNHKGKKKRKTLSIDSYGN